MFFIESKSYGVEKNPLMLLTSKIAMNFPIMSVSFNQENSKFLAIGGSKDCVILTVNPRTGTLSSKLLIETMLAALGDQFNLMGVEWIPGSHVRLAIGAFNFIRIYDLSEDNIAPLINIELIDGMIKHFQFLNLNPTTNPPGNNNTGLQLFVGSSNGLLYSYMVEEQALKCRRSVSPHRSPDRQRPMEESNFFLTDPVEISNWPADTSRSLLHIGVHRASSYITLSYSDGSFLLCEEVSHSVSGGSRIKNWINLNPVEKEKNSEVFKGSSKFRVMEMGIKGEETLVLSLIFQNSKGNRAPAMVKVTPSQVTWHFLKNVGNSSSQNIAEGICGIRGVRLGIAGEEKPRLLSIFENGSILSYEVPCLGTPGTSPKGLSRGHKQGIPVDISTIVIPKEIMPHTVEMPVDFFESCVNALEKTPSHIVLGGNIFSKGGSAGQIVKKLKNFYNTDAISPPGSETKIEVKVNNQEIVIAGVRLKIGQSPRSLGKISIEVLNRKIAVDKIGNSWYEFPLCDIEILGVAGKGGGILNVSVKTQDTSSAPIKLYNLDIFTKRKLDIDFVDKVHKLQIGMSSKAYEKRVKTLIKQPEKKKKGGEMEKQDDIDIDIDADGDIDAEGVGGSLGEILSAIERLRGLLSTTECELLLEEICNVLGTAEDGKYINLDGALKSTIITLLQVIHKGHSSTQLLHLYLQRKDQAQINNLISGIKGNLSLDSKVFKGYLQLLAKIGRKREKRLFQVFDEEQGIMHLILQQLLKGIDEDNTLIGDFLFRNIIENYWFLFTYYFDYLCMKKAETMQDHIQDSYQVILDMDLSLLTPFIRPFLLSPKEEVKKMSLRKLSEILYINIKQVSTPKDLNTQDNIQNYDFSFGLCLIFLADDWLIQNSERGEELNATFSLIYRIIKYYDTKLKPLTETHPLFIQSFKNIINLLMQKGVYIHKYICIYANIILYYACR